MKNSEIRYWRDTIKMCEDGMAPRVERWNALKRRLALDFSVRGLKKNQVLYISRFYKLVREVIASIAFRYPHVFVKAEEDPADPYSGEVLANATPILEDFANDAIELMKLKPKLRQMIFDALFCFRGWAKIGMAPRESGMVAPYLASDDIAEDFTYIARVRPEHVLVDPLVSPENLYSARYIIEKMYVPLNFLIDDEERFGKFKTRLRGLKKEQGSPTEGPLDPDQTIELADEEQKHMLRRAHQLAHTVKAYEIHDRIDRRRLFFVDGIEEPVEEIDHPFLADVVVMRTDPLTGKPLLGLVDRKTGTAGIAPRQKFLVEGGLPYFSMSFDVTGDFYGEPIMAYENPIQNAIIRSVSRRQDLLERFKRISAMRRAELDNNPDLARQVRDAEDGDILPLEDPNSIVPVNWGGTLPDQVLFERDMLSYEGQTIRTAPSFKSDSATGEALEASEAQLNREFNQEPVENFYIWAVRNTFSILSDERYVPQEHLLRLTSVQGAAQTRLALRSWHLRGRCNISIAAGSMNVLYEQMHRERTLGMVQFLRGSPNVDQLKLDKFIIRAHGEIDPESLLKDDANTDAAKSAELENQMFFTLMRDPGVIQGEDHNTHIALQNPDAVSQYPQFQQLAPEMQQLVLRVAAGHIAQHQQMAQQEMGRFHRIKPARTRQRPVDLQSQVRSNAQIMSDIVAEEAVQGAAEGK